MEVGPWQSSSPAWIFLFSILCFVHHAIHLSSVVSMFSPYQYIKVIKLWHKACVFLKEKWFKRTLKSVLILTWKGINHANSKQHPIECCPKPVEHIFHLSLLLRTVYRNYIWLSYFLLSSVDNVSQMGLNLQKALLLLKLHWN